MWQENGRIVQIDTLCTFRSVSEHFGVYVFYGIECSEPKILYIGESAKLFNRLPQHLSYPTSGDRTGTFYKNYRNYWIKKRGSTDARPYWKQYWDLLCRSELMVMAWPIDNGADGATDTQHKAIRKFESKLIQSFSPKYNKQKNPGGDLERCRRSSMDGLRCELRQKLKELKTVR